MKEANCKLRIFFESATLAMTFTIKATRKGKRHLSEGYA